MASLNEGELTTATCSSDLFSPLLAATVPNLHDSDNIPRSPPSSPLSSTSGLLAQMSAMSPSPVDVNALRSENRTLRSRVRQLQADLQAEQDTVAALRKRTNNVEKERLDSVSRTNEEISRLDSEATKLRAQLEKGEAVRQGLEYELTKTRREIEHDRRHAAERETLMTDVNDSMKQKISELTTQLEQMCEQLDTTKKTSSEETRKLTQLLEEKEKMISESRSEKDLVEADRDRLDSALEQKDSTIIDLEDRVQELEDARILDKENLRRQMTENDIMREREERNKAELESSLMRIKALEDNIEAERAAHLESKFNSEIIQLRIRDLEGALEMEKSTKLDMSETKQKLAKQISELQQVYDQERMTGMQTREKLEKAEKEYEVLSRQLRLELEDKKTIIKTLSGQLDVHQKNFNELKDELSKAKKRQIFLEETYSGSMKELEVLVQGFQLSDYNVSPRLAKTSSASTTTTTAGKKKATSQRKRDSHKSQPPAVLLESLRHLLIDYKRKLDQTSGDLTRVKVQNEAMAKECAQHRQAMTAKDKALESTQQGMSNSSKELVRLRAENKESAAILRQVQDELRRAQRALDQALAQNQDLNNQVVQLAKKCTTDERASVDFLQNVYQQLMILSRPTTPGDGSSGVQTLSPSNWSELTVMVNERINVLLAYLQASEEKVKELELAVDSRDHLVAELQKGHEQQLQKLCNLTENRSQQWQLEKQEMEQQYSRLLAEVHTRQKKTQTLADQAWEKMRVTGSVQHSLESECSQLRSHIERCQKEHDALLTACALLCGALYPLYARTTALSAQRILLSDQLANHESFKHQVNALVEALSLKGPDQNKDEKEHRQLPQAKRKLPPILRFRVGVLAVMAANRLCHMAQYNCRMFTAQDALPGLYSMLVCAGGVQAKPVEFSGVSNAQLLENERSLRRGEDQAIHWLRSGELLSTVVATMADVLGALEQARKQGEMQDMRKIVSAARSSFQKLICNLPGTFASVPVEQQLGVRERVSTVSFLGHGLNRALAQLSLEGSSAPHLVNSQHTLTALQQHIVEFTQRLHTAEVERRDLRLELGELHQQRQHWMQQGGALEVMHSEVNSLRQQVDQTVERSRFEQVCQELNNALRREQEAQEILRVQSQQIHELGLRLDVQVSEGSEKEHTLVDAIQGLSDAKRELKKQEQIVRQLNREMSLLDGKKRELEENVKDAENALRTAAKDREGLTSYIHSVERTLDKMQTQRVLSGSSPVDFTPLLSPDLVPANLKKKGPELIACQTLVSAFVTVERQLDNRVRSLQADVDSHKQHISTLKEELSNACRREYEDEIEKMKLLQTAEVPNSPPVQGPSAHRQNGSKTFSPLEADSDATFCTPKPSSAKTPTKASKSGLPRSKPLVYRTPKTAGKTSRGKSTDHIIAKP